MGLGMGELLVILVIVLLIFGAGKLPQIGDALGKAIGNFKSSVKGNKEQDAIEVTKKKEITQGRSAADDEEDAEVAAPPKASKKQQS